MAWDVESKRRIANAVEVVEEEVIDLVPLRSAKIRRGEGGGRIPLTGDVWLLNKHHTFDPNTSYKYIVGYANTNTIELTDVVADEPPPNTYVRRLANEQGDIYMGC